jgi:hypothetical protein
MIPVASGYLARRNPLKADRLKGGGLRPGDGAKGQVEMTTGLKPVESLATESRVAAEAA